MGTTLKGVVFSGMGYASRNRFPECKAIFEKRGITFPPFVCGTLNIQLEKPFEPPKTDCVRMHVPHSEMPGQPESWDIIPVSQINGICTCAYIYRTSTNHWGDDVVELIAHDLGDASKIGQTITLELPHRLDGLREKQGY